LTGLVSRLGFLESSKGDELHFTLLNSSLPNDQGVDQATYESVANLLKFIIEESEIISSANGFPAQQFTLGAAVGIGELIIDERHVRTSGNFVNYAKRLQQIAGKNQALLCNFHQVNELRGFSLSSEQSFIVKKNVIAARELRYGQAFAALNDLVA
jgi:hypothetical protein